MTPPSPPLVALDIDPSTPGFALRPDYYELLGRLRAEAPVYDCAPGVKAVSRYHDIREISRDPARFCSSRGVLVNDPLREGGRIEGSLLHLDPPAHGEWRRVLNRRFTPRAVAPLTEQIRGHVRRLLDAVDPAAEIDLVEALTAPLPVLVIAEFLGVPEAVRPDFRRWSDATIEASDGRAALPAAAMDAIVELVAFLEELVVDRAAAPGDDVVSLLAGAEIEGRRLRRSELVTFMMTLLVAGNETTRHLLSTGLVTLAAHPDQRAALAADPALTPTAVEELLRWVTPIQQFARTATGDTELGGHPVAAGDYLVLLYASGNRDEEAFGPTAARFDARRPIDVPNLAFGFGEHLCLGAALARLEARVVVDEILARHPHYEIAGDVEWVASSLVRGPARVPVVLR